MKIATVAVTDFRSYAEYSLTLAAPTTLLCGPNGCGKTNLLEAMYLLPWENHRARVMIG